MGQLSLEKTFIIAPYIEGMVYGFFVAIFAATMYIHFSKIINGPQQLGRHSNVMIGISSLMFFIATLHMAVNAYRVISGYVDHASILEDTLYATQENLGSAAAVGINSLDPNTTQSSFLDLPLLGALELQLEDYRVSFSIIDCQHRYVHYGSTSASYLLPMFTILVAGYMVCGLYTTVSSTINIFNPRLTTWIKIFFPLTVALNIITTSLMSYRIWYTHSQATLYASGNDDSQLMSVMRTLVESAALQLVVEIVLLALYSSDINAQYIVLESIAPIVGITFNALTIRIKLRSMSAARNDGDTQTIGRLPMRRLQVNVAIEQTEDSDSIYSK
ncbi:hypothetical protein F5050DRAFT_1805050 [Lentinula boryana]|uniref:Uncharacterized protein n=1 Tax=Lentinula boryana TaxID=40481 RepID=A0ABQ8QLP1_9AGAR|nr:hypothetical protein F5050DRAFT_1805050 [Lentinula boryana]